MTEFVDEARLRKHVEALASDIGERNVSKPESLAAASSYIEAEWRTQGYDVAKQVYEADGTPDNTIDKLAFSEFREMTEGLFLAFAALAT